MNMNMNYQTGGNPSKLKIAAFIVGIVVVVIVLIVSLIKKPTPPVRAPTPTPAPAPAPARVVKAEPAVVPDRQLSGCESDPALLKCDSGLIKGGNIRYGRWNNSVCPHPTVNASTPFKEKTYQMYTGCLNKPECTLAGGSYNQNLQEDIYPNVYKQWEIKYQCQ